jgi:GNAT superfamily N-acetyltransferase
MPSDSLAELTELLHRAYAALAQRGLRYVATYQDEATTARRIAGGTCLVATLGNRLVGTITFKPRLVTMGCSWYQRPGVAYCGQFGISPAHQGLRIGSLLMDLVEERAWSTGAQEIALDTSEQADDLIAWYRRRRYRLVGEADWELTNYRSVVLSKHLALPELTLRDLGGSDGDLVASMLVESVNWDHNRPRVALPDVLAQSTFCRYVDGWGCDDAGIVVEDGAGAPIGAAWRRSFPTGRPGFGFVAEDVPEISVAVRRPWRGHGLGNRLLAALETQAQRTGIAALSLSVETANPAHRLYERRGYRTVARTGITHTMVLNLSATPKDR